MLSVSQHEGGDRQPPTSLRKGAATLIPRPPLGKTQDHRAQPSAPGSQPKAMTAPAGTTTQSSENGRKTFQPSRMS